MSTGTLVAIGVVGLAAVGGVVLYLKKRPHAELARNPTSSLPPPAGAQPEQFPPRRSSTRRKPSKRPIAFRVSLGVSPAYDFVQLMPDSTAVYYRYGYKIARFRPAPYQFSKISHGEGDLFIYADQILENLVGR